MPYWKFDYTRIRRTYRDYRELFKAPLSKDDLKGILESYPQPISVYIVGKNKCWITPEYQTQVFRWDRSVNNSYLFLSEYNAATERRPVDEGRAMGSGTEGEALGWGAND